MNKQTVSLLTAGLMALVLWCSPTYADLITIPISSATSISFQDEGTASADHTARLDSLDGLWAPLTVGTVTNNYYATGTSPAYWDAVSLNFDLSSVGWENIVSAELRFYTQQGAYWRTEWHHYELLQGAYNPTHEDVGPLPPVPDMVSFGPPNGSNVVVGWVSASVPMSWITSDDLDVTLRLWNARIDKVELLATVVPVPGAVLLGLLGLSVAGVKLRRRA